MKFNLTTEHILQKAPMSETGDEAISTIALPSGQCRIKINTAFGKAVHKIRDCHFLGEKTSTVQIDDGFPSMGYQACGDILITLVEMGYDLTKRADLKRAKKADKEKIISEYHRLIESKPKLFIPGNMGIATELSDGLPLFTDKKSINEFLNANKTNLENGIILNGVGRQLVIYDDKVCIENTGGVMGTISLLEGQGKAEAYFQDITSIVHVPTQLLNIGKLIVKVKGHVELKKNDPFTIDIPKKHNEQFSQAKILLDYLLKKSKTSSSQPATVIQEKQPDIIEQIKKLAELRDSGILSDEEFESKKTELLSRM